MKEKKDTMTREKKRRRQRMKGNAVGALWILFFVALGAVTAILSLEIIRSGAVVRAEEETEAVNGKAEMLPATAAERLPAIVKDIPAVPVALAGPEQDHDPEPGQARYPITDYERDLVERVVEAEAANQGYDGLRLVAQCILNTAEERGMRPDAVVLEKNQYTTPAAEAGEETKAAVAAVFDRGELFTEEPIRWFYAPRYSEGIWHESRLTFVLEYGGHRFFKEG